MDLFKVSNFDSNTIGDNACKQLLSIGNRKLNPIVSAKVAKKKIKKKKKTLNDSQINKDKTTKEQIVRPKSIVNTDKSKSKSKSNSNVKNTKSPDVKRSVEQKQKGIKKNMKKSQRQVKEQSEFKQFSKKKWNEMPLKDRMMAKLQSARFRFLNEQIYSTNSKDAQKLFSQDPQAFKAYHDGYRRQVNKWPLNPVDVIIKSIQKMPKSHIVVDMGCGEAKLTKSVSQTVHSFDLIATNENVTACDMAHVPLDDQSVDIVVFCLSLMGTNLKDYIVEANRILKQGGTLKIAEIESRFENVGVFIELLKKYHFKNTFKDFSNKLFYFMDFKKENCIKNKKKLPTLSLQPCLYKKR